MNKKDLISAVAEELSYTKKDVTAVVDTLVSKLASALINGTDVSIVGLGKFKISERAGRIGRNPRTGEPVEIAAKNVVKFSPTKELKDAIATA